MAFEQTTTVEQKLFDGSTVAENIRNGKYVISTIGVGSARDEQPGRFYDFDGSNDVVVAPSEVSAAIQANDVGTISLWFNRDVQEVSTLFGASDSGDVNSILTISNTLTGGIRLLITEASSTVLDVSTTLNLAPSMWYHIVVTMGTSGASIYINGALQILIFATGDASTQAWFDTLNNIDDIALGSHKASGAYTSHFNGRLFDCKVFDIELTASQVTDLYIFESSVATRLHYKCDDTHPTIAYDSSGNSYHGTKTLITAATFHGEGSAVPYSYQNEVGFSNYYNFLLDGSENINSAGGWLLSQVISTQDATVDPDGNTNAWLIEKTSTATTRFITSDVSIPSALTGHISVFELWAKEGTSDKFGIGLHDGAFRNFDIELLEGTADIALFGGRLRVTNMNGWIKIRMKSPATTNNIDIIMYPDLSSSVVSGASNYIYHPHVYSSGVGNGQYIHATTATIVDGNIPRNENSATLDVITGDLTSSLQYNGQVPRNGKLVESACGTFDGVNDYVTTVSGTTSELDITDNLSVFIRTANANATMTGIEDMISKNDVGIANGRAWRFYIDDLNILSTHFINSGTWAADTAITDTSVISSYGFTFDGGVVQLYNNGFPVDGSETSGTLPASITENNAPLTIGSHLNIGIPTGNWEGRIFDVKVYNTTVLSDNNMLYLHTQGQSGTDPGTGNLVGHWPISEGVGQIVHNVTTNKSHGIVNGATTSSPGVGFWANTQDEYHYSITNGFDTAWYQEDTTHIDVGNHVDYDITGNFAMTLWFLMNGAPNVVNRSLISRWDTVGDQRSWRIYADNTSNDRVVFAYSHDGTATGVDDVPWFSNPDPFDGAWHCLGVTWEKDSNNIFIYANGVFKGADFGHIPPFPTGTASIKIGGGPQISQPCWIRDVTIYSGDVMSNSNHLYVATNGAEGIEPTATVAANWPLNNITGTNVPSSISSEHDGTVINPLANNRNWAFEIPAQHDGFSSIASHRANSSLGTGTIASTAGLFNGSSTNINFAPVVSPHSTRVYRGYATVLTTSSVIDFNDLDGVTVSSYTVPDGLDDPLGTVSSNQIVFASTGNISNLVLSDGTTLTLYKDSLDYVGSNHGVSSGITFDTYPLEISYGFGESPVGLSKVGIGVNESCLQYISTIWTLAAAVVETHPYIFVNIGNSVFQSTPERENGHFTGFSNTILPMTTHSGQFKRNDGYDI